MHRLTTLGIYATILASIGTPANAELIERDWQSTGDAALTYDTETGLEWLDITLTAAQSWNEVASQLITGGIYDGFSFATEEQTLGIFGAVGLHEHPLGNTTAGNKIQRLQSFWGVTWDLGTGGRTAFLTAHTDGLPAGQHWLGRIVWLDPDNTGVTATYEGVDDTFASTNNGSALVRSAVPSTVNGQGSWETTLVGRDLDGDITDFEGWYDNALDITWLANASYIETSGYDDDGWVQWDDALAWISHLNETALYGYTGWRLPTIGPINGLYFSYETSYDGTTDRTYNATAPGTLYSGSTVTEMSHLYFNTLGNLALYEFDGTPRTAGNGATNTGPFSNLRQAGYWYDLEYALDSSGAWKFDFRFGYQDPDPKFVTNYSAWAVHSGDIGVARRGDINKDTAINVADLLLAQQHLHGLTTLDSVQIANADFYPVMGDGELTVSDYMMLREKIFAQ